LDREGYSELKVKTDAIKDTIFTHGEFSNYKDTVYQSFDNWKDNHLDTLQSINPETVPKAIIHQLSEDILEKFIDVPLVEAYEMYQHVMRYWYDTMKDDVFVIVEDGWQANEILIPKVLMVERYFYDEQNIITQLETELDQFEQEQENLLDENNEEDSIFEEVKSDAGNITKANVNKKIKELKDDSDYKEEFNLLQSYREAEDNISKVKKDIKEHESSLNEKIKEKYETISHDGVKEIVIHDKWMNHMLNVVDDELERVSQRLTSRIEELSERYADTLPQLEKEYEALVEKVDGHLQRMGFEW